MFSVLSSVWILLIGSFSFGYGIGFPGMTINDISHDFVFMRNDESTFSSLSSLFAIVGPFISNYFMKTRGRKNTTKYLALLSIFSWGLLAMANRIWHSFLHRALVGVTIGAYSSVIPTYINEISPPSKKNIYGTMNQFGIAFGVFFCDFIGIYLNWIALSLFMCVLSFVFFILLMNIPDSPVSQQSQDGPGPIFNIHLFSGKNLPLLMQGVLFMFFQQFGGVNAVLSNISAILGEENKYSPCIAALAQCISCFFSMMVVEKIGRLMTWRISTLGASLSILFLGIYTQSIVSTISAFMYLFFFCFGLGPIPWMIAPDMFDDDVRSTASSILSSINWLFSFIVVYNWPKYVKLFGRSSMLFIFSAILFGGFFMGRSSLNGRKDQQRIHFQNFEENNEEEIY